MKKLFLICAVAFAGLVNAQEVSPSTNLDGAWWVMGSASYSNSEEVGLQPKKSSFEIMPVVGTFISPSVTVGLGLGYESSKVGDNDAVDAFSVMPLGRKYWGVANNLYIFGQAAVPMKFYDNYKTFGFQLSPGVDYFLSSNFSIEASFGVLSYTNFSPDEGDSYGETEVGINTADLNFGLKYIF